MGKYVNNWNSTIKSWNFLNFEKSFYCQFIIIDILSYL